MIQREVSKTLKRLLSFQPVVMLTGPRQAGKSTLVEFVAPELGARYISLDDSGQLSDAQADPGGFLARYEQPLVIDEAQRAPDLFLAIKRSVDRQRVAGKFLLTGSANVLLLPKVADSLAGRMSVLNLWPLSASELLGSTDRNFIDDLFAEGPPEHSDALAMAELAKIIATGGFPVAVGLDDAGRQLWFDGYVDTLIQRDVRELSNIEALAEMPRLLSLLAARAGGVLNVASLTSGLDLQYATLTRYLALLELLFTVIRIPAWRENIGKRLVKSPKIYLVDTGLLANRLRVSVDRLLEDRIEFGRLLENFVVLEVLKAASWSSTKASPYYFRTEKGAEVDLVLETTDRRIVGIEIKSSPTVSGKDLRGLKTLREATGERFIRGVILHTGDGVEPLGERLTAMPVQSIWGG